MKEMGTGVNEMETGGKEMETGGKEMETGGEAASSFTASSPAFNLTSNCSPKVGKPGKQKKSSNEQVSAARGAAATRQLASSPASVSVRASATALGQGGCGAGGAGIRAVGSGEANTAGLVHGDQAQRAMASSATHSDDISSLINGVESIRVAGFGTNPVLAQY